MSCTIRKATPWDLPRIREIYEVARQFMRKNGNHSQWGKGDEPEALIEEDICQGNILFAVLKNPQFFFPGKVPSDFCRTSHHKRTIWYHSILRHKTSSSYNTVISNLCTVKYHCPHSNQRSVPNRTAMNHCIMSHCNIISDTNRHVTAHMNRTVFLNI